MYSDNGLDPSMFLMEHPTLIGQVVKSPLYWGYNYRFQVSWSGYPESHSFLVTEYYGDLYIYQHTFHPDIEVSDRFQDSSSKKHPAYRIRSIKISKRNKIQIYDK